MEQISIWEKETFLPPSDVVIIGAGIVGLSTAIALKRHDPTCRVSVLERGSLPSGASTKNAGFACFGSLSEILDDLDRMPADAVFQLIRKRYLGLEELRNLIGDDRMDFRPCGGYEIFSDRDKDACSHCLDQLDTVNLLLREITGRPDTFELVSSGQIRNFGFRQVHAMLFNRSEGHLHSGKMMKSLIGITHALDIPVLWGLPVTEVREEDRKVSVRTLPGWSLEASCVLIATNGFARQFLPDLPLFPARNQVLVTKPLSSLPFQGTFHYDRGYVYFRDVPGPVPGSSRVLLGGARHLAADRESTDRFGLTPDIQAFLTDLLHSTILPDSSVDIDYWWSGILGVGPEKSPIVSFRTDRIACAVRMGGMGVAIGTLIGQEAAGMIWEKLRGNPWVHI
jgi:glycine/D-amino acid oxidase-like deaminating enzyme